MFEFKRYRYSLVAGIFASVLTIGCSQRESKPAAIPDSTSDSTFQHLKGKHPILKKGPADILGDTTGKGR
jgi:nitrous oxide reductase accessory protein NosL